MRIINMKKLVFLIIISLSVLSLQAQRLNKDGRKVVKEIVLERYNNSGERVSSKHYFRFSYHPSLELNTLEYESEPLGGGYIDYNRKVLTHDGNKLIRKDYVNGKLTTDWSYEYELNDSGRVVKRMRYDYAIDGSFITRIDSDIAYDENGRLETVSTCQYYKGRNDKTYTKLDDDIISDIRHFVIKEDGNRYYERTQVCKYGSTHYDVDSREFIYGEYINDTNVNFNQFFTQYCWDLTGNEIDFITEWYNVYSNNLLEKQTRYNRYMKYVYDEKGNLIEFSVHNSYTDKVIRRFLIKYLE